MSSFFQSGNYNYNVDIEENNSSESYNIRRMIVATGIGLLYILPNQVFTSHEDLNASIMYNSNESHNSSSFIIESFDEDTEIWNLPKKGDENSMANENISEREFESYKETTEQRFKNLESQLSRIEVTLNQINNKLENLTTKEDLGNTQEQIKELPTKDYVSSEIKGQTNKYLLWLGGGLVATIGVLLMFLESMLSAAG